MAARDLRRNWCEELVDKYGYAVYATAHHLDDQSETFFINLLRGTGISGIHGILPISGNLIHPMMFAWKKEIIRYARVNRISYRLDKSNLTTDYDRNFIRHKLLPIIYELNPGFDVTLKRNIQHFRQTEIIYRQRIKEITDKILQTDKKGMRLKISDLLNLDVATVYLYEILADYNFNRIVVDDIYKALDSESGKIFHSPTHRLVVDREYVMIEKNKGNYDGAGIFNIQQTDLYINEPVEIKLTHLEKSPKTEIKGNPQFAMLDMEKLKFPLVIRKWQRGDYFYPLGMSHKKLISDYFIDNKFSIFHKENTWLLLSENRIAWIIGHRIDERFKITTKTKKILKLELIKS
jgi:tRNA(Ile)-lysidine synthase